MREAVANSNKQRKEESFQLVVMNPSADSIDYQSPTSGKTALHLACEAGEIGAVTRLISAGADPAIIDRNGYCALEVWKRRISRNS